MILIETFPAPATVQGLEKDVLEIEWYETRKGIIRRRSLKGRDLALRRSDRTPLTDGQVIWQDEQAFVAVDIRPCECLVIRPRNMQEMGQVCFEIGNMHLPISIDDACRVSVAYDSPLHTFLQRRRYEVEVSRKKLLDAQLLTLHEIKR